MKKRPYDPDAPFLASAGFGFRPGRMQDVLKESIRAVWERGRLPAAGVAIDVSDELASYPCVCRDARPSSASDPRPYEELSIKIEGLPADPAFHIRPGKFGSFLWLTLSEPKTTVVAKSLKADAVVSANSINQQYIHPLVDFFDSVSSDCPIEIRSGERESFECFFEPTLLGNGAIKF